MAIHVSELPSSSSPPLLRFVDLTKLGMVLSGQQNAIAIEATKEENPVAFQKFAGIDESHRATRPSSVTKSKQRIVNRSVASHVRRSMPKNDEMTRMALCLLPKPIWPLEN